MFSIYDGRKAFFQWDLDRKLIVNDSSINQVHFCNRTDTCSLVCEVYEENGQRLVNVPNVLLQTDWRINVYGYDKNYTKHSAVFEVIKRSKPEDYILTEEDVKTWEEINSRVEELEKCDREWTKLCDITVSDTIEFNPISFTGGVVTLDTNAEGYSFMNIARTSVVFHPKDITATNEPMLYQLRPRDYAAGIFDAYNNDGVAQPGASIDVTKFKMSVANIGEVSMTNIPDYDRYKVRFTFPTMKTHGFRPMVHGNVDALTFGASNIVEKGGGVIMENELLSFPYDADYMVRKSSIDFGPFYSMNYPFRSAIIIRSGVGKTKPVNGVVTFKPSACPFVNGSRFELWGVNDV